VLITKLLLLSFVLFFLPGTGHLQENGYSQAEKTPRYQKGEGPGMEGSARSRSYYKTVRYWLMRE
jgi:hypothetical protein